MRRENKQQQLSKAKRLAEEAEKKKREQEEKEQEQEEKEQEQEEKRINEIEKRNKALQEKEQARKDEEERKKQKKAIELERFRVELERGRRERAREEEERMRVEEELKQQAMEEDAAKRRKEDEKQQEEEMREQLMEEIDAEKSMLEESMTDLKEQWQQLREWKGQLHEEKQGDESPLYMSNVAHSEQQTDIDGNDVEKVIQENETLKSLKFDINVIKGNDDKTSFYTGLKSWAVFVHLHMFLSPHITACASLSSENELFLVLVRLRLGLLLEDLSDRFQVSIPTVSKVFKKWLNVMYTKLKFLIKWPSREVCRKNLPASFKHLYPNCVCIIDCSEIFIETPVSFEARNKTYSNYKKNNTIKFLIGITPNGSISFLSKCWGGRVSDKIITQESGLFNNLLPGDVVLADRGFTLADDFAMCGAKLVIPSFTRGKNQLLQIDVENSKQLSSVRIHVERVIGNLKKKYRILRGPLPISLLKHADDVDNVANIDKILVTCSALTNLSDHVVD